MGRKLLLKTSHDAGCLWRALRPIIQIDHLFPQRAPMSQSLHNLPIALEICAQCWTFRQAGIVLLRRRRSTLFALTFSPPAAIN